MTCGVPSKQSSKESTTTTTVSAPSLRMVPDTEPCKPGFAYDRTRSQSRTGAGSSASILSRPPDSRRVSFDDDREFQAGSSASQLPQRMPSQPPVRGAGSRTPSRQREPDGDDRGRKNKPFTFASALLEAMKDRVRSKSPLIEREAHHGEVTPPRGRARDRVILEEPEKPILKELSALGRVGEALGFDVDDGREHGDGWKEFRRGMACTFGWLQLRPDTIGRCIYISCILRHSCEFASNSARRLWLGTMEAQGRSTSARRVQSQTPNFSRSHRRHNAV